MDDYSVAHDPDRAVPLYLAVLYITAADCSDVGNLVNLAHLGMADNRLSEFRSQHALHCRLYLIYAVVNDTVHANIHIVSRGVVTGGVVRTDIKANDNRAACGRKHYVGLAYSTHGGVNYLYPYLVVGQLLKGLLYGLGRALYVRFYYNIQVLNLALLYA